MKSKTVCVFLLALVCTFLLAGCGGGGSSNPTASSQALSSVTVNVKDNNGTPIEGAKVVLVPATLSAAESLIKKNTRSLSARMSTSASSGEYSGITDSNGEATINNVPEGKYSLTATKNGAVQINQSIDVAGGKSVTVPTVQLVPAGKITGTVTDEGDKAVSSALVYIKGTSLLALSDSKGYYSMESVPVNTDLKISVNGYDFDESVCIKTTAEETNFTLTKNICVKNPSVNFLGLNIIVESHTDLDADKWLVVGVGANGNSVVAPLTNAGTKKYVAVAKILNPDEYTFVVLCLDQSLDSFKAAPVPLSITSDNIKSGKISKIITFNLSQSEFKSIVATLPNMTGEVLTKYQLVLVNQDTSLNREMDLKNGKANYAFDSLPPGSYTLILVSDEKIAVKEDINIPSSASYCTEVTVDSPKNVVPEYKIASGAINVTNVVSISDKNREKVSFTLGDPIVYENSLVELSKLDANKLTDTKEFTPPSSGETAISLSTDNVESGTYCFAAAYTLFKADGKTPYFKRVFKNETNLVINDSSRRIVTLSDIASSEEVCLFDVVKYNDKNCFVLVTSSSSSEKTKLYSYDSSGESIRSDVVFSCSITPDQVKVAKKDEGYNIYFAIKDGGKINIVWRNPFEGSSKILNTNIYIDADKSIDSFYFDGSNKAVVVVDNQLYYIDLKSAASVSYESYHSNDIIRGYSSFAKKDDSSFYWKHLAYDNTTNYAKFVSDLMTFNESTSGDSTTLSLDYNSGVSWNLGSVNSLNQLKTITKEDGCNTHHYYYYPTETLAYKLIGSYDAWAVIEKVNSTNYIVCDSKDSSLYVTSELKFDKMETTNDWQSSNWCIERNENGQFVCCSTLIDGEQITRKYEFPQITNSKSFLEGSLKKSAISSANQIYYIGGENSKKPYITILNY